MGYGFVTKDEYTHTAREVHHIPSGVQFWIYPLEVKDGTWPTTKRKQNGIGYELVEIRWGAEKYLEMVGVIVEVS